MSLRTMTDEQKRLAMEDYNNPEIKAITVRKKWGLSSRDMTALIVEMGGEFRNPNKAGTRGKAAKAKTCPKCRRKVDLKGAKFCPYCGADIRDEKELTLEKVTKLFSFLGFLPINSRDEAQELIKEIEAYITKH